MHPSSTPRTRIRSWISDGKIAPWLVLLLFGIGTFFAWRTVRENTEAEMRTAFDFQVSETMSRIDQRMRAYEQVLRGVGGLFASSPSPVTRRQFHDYYTALRLEKNYPGIQGIGFSKVLKPGEIESHTRAVREETGMDYTVRPGGHREFYSSIVYLEPFTGRNLRAFGFDMYSEPDRRAAMARAADSATSAITGKVTLVQETNEDVQAGFLMFRPFYRTMEKVPPPAQRRAELVGWVYAPFRMNDLMQGLIGPSASGTEIEIYDGAAADEGALMYESARGGSRHADAHFNETRTITIIGHPWTVVIRSVDDFEKRFDTTKPLIIAAAGVGISILFALLAFLLVNSRSRALEALRTESRYKNLMQQANDGILVVDMQRRITDANEQACSHFGYTLEELRSMRLEDLHPPEHRAEVIGRFALLRPHESSRFEVISMRKDGSLVPDEISERVVQLENEEYVLKFVRDISERKRAEHEREMLVGELQEALADVKTLSGLIPICSSCKKIRDDTGYWNVLEKYLIEHSEAQFTHGLCPDCMKRLYPQYAARQAVGPDPEPPSEGG